MIWALSSIGRVFFDFLASTGRLTLFLAHALIQGFTPPYYLRQMVRQFWEIGYLSLPVVGLTALFTGMVLRFKAIPVFRVLMRKVLLRASLPFP